MISIDYKESMDDEILATIESNIDKLDDSYLDFVLGFMADKPKIYLPEGGMTFLAFLEGLTGIEGPGALRTFLSDLVKENPIMKWETVDQVRDSDFNKKCRKVEECIGDLKYSMQKAWRIDLQSLGLDTIIDYQVRGNLGIKFPGYDTLLGQATQDLKASGIDWCIPIDTKKTNCPGIEELRKLSKPCDCMRANANYQKFENGKVYLNPEENLWNVDYSWEIVFVPLSKIVDGHKNSNEVSTWLRKEDVLLLGYNVL